VGTGWSSVYPGKYTDILTDFQTSLGYFHVFQVVEHIRTFRTNTVKNETFSKKSKISIFGEFLPILATFYEVKITF
jgi:hypothetical protein